MKQTDQAIQEDELDYRPIKDDIFEGGQIKITTEEHSFPIPFRMIESDPDLLSTVSAKISRIHLLISSEAVGDDL